MSTPRIASLLTLTLALCAAAARAQEGATWTRQTETDDLHAQTFQAFSLPGEYVVPPSQRAGDGPAIVVQCSLGHLLGAWVSVGAVVAPDPDAHSLGGNGRAYVELRFDERKPTADYWEILNSGTALDIGGVDLDQLLTGSMIGHPSEPAKLTRRVLIGVTEALGNEVQLRFAMPPDASQLVLACGLEYNRKLRNALRDRVQNQWPRP